MDTATHTKQEKIPNEFLGPAAFKILLSTPKIEVYTQYPWGPYSLIIAKAFHGMPSDIEDWDLEMWEHTCRTAKDIISKSIM